MLSSAADERGFTLIELLVTMTVLLLVSGGLLSALESGMRTERRASDRIDGEQAVRLALAQLTRDVRNADSISATDLSTLPDEIDLVRGGEGITWRYDPAARRLTRLVNTGATSAPGISVDGVSNGLNPVFRLLGRVGADLAAAPGATAADAFRCAVAVQASVTSASRAGGAAFTETAVAGLRAPADLEGCP